MDNLMINPEGLEVANKYLENPSITDTASSLGLSTDVVSDWLNKAEVKRYIDSVYLDAGYRNRFKLGNLLDTIIESKLEEAEESEIYSDKDLIEILTLAHKMRIEEIKTINSANVNNQTNIQINSENSVFGDGNYGKLMKRLLGDES